MALLKREKNKEKAPVAEEMTGKVSPSAGERTVLLRPRITEKATEKSMNENVYVFEVAKDANKREVMAALKGMYKVTPLKVRMARIPSKVKFIRGKWGKEAAGKKAYIYLKEGDKIDIA